MFNPRLFAFLDELAQHNDREWFAANKARYEADAKTPMVRFVTAMQPELARIAPSYVADERSIFRIYRDTRFSKDKSPYKTHVAAQFRYAGGGDVHAPGFYVHFGAEECLVGVGLWRPEPKVLRQVREAMLADPEAWRRATAGLTLGGEATKRPPTGVPADHPLVEDLKRKDFVAMTPLTREEAVGGEVVRVVGRHFERGAPLVRFLTQAVGLRW